MLEKEELTGKIINACMEVHNELGNGFLEAVYQEALEEEFLIKENSFCQYCIREKNLTKNIMRILSVSMKS